MIETGKRIIASVLAVICCLAVISSGAYAYGGSASDENGYYGTAASAESIYVSTEDVTIPSGYAAGPEVTWDINAEDIDIVLSGLTFPVKGVPLTPDGNLTLVDDIIQSDTCTVEDTRVLNGKQFITVKTRNGSFFYIIIDRSSDSENVYFLNLVDESDLLALLDDGGEKEAAVCTCRDRCEYGSVDTECPICRYDMERCTGTVTARQDAPQADSSAGVDAGSQNSGRDSGTGLWIILILVLLAGGAALYWFRFRDRDSGGKAGSRYGYDEEEAEFEKADANSEERDD